jgi:hypothetical protein
MRAMMPETRLQFDIAMAASYPRVLDRSPSALIQHFNPRTRAVQRTRCA